VTLAPSNLDLFRSRFNEVVRSTVPADAFVPAIDLDAEIMLADISFSFLKQSHGFEPFGQGNGPIQFAAKRLRVGSEPRRIGSEQQHLKFTATDGSASHVVLWWNCPEVTEIPPAFDLAFTPELNEHNGTFGIQLKALDLRPC
jgi:single-stranded-DNA-specific exonuclease